MKWYELDRRRFLSEFDAVRRGHPRFELKKTGAELLWEGELDVSVANIPAESLKIRVVYPQAYPAQAPDVEILAPQMDPKDVGHDWHRWAQGNICYVRPRDWNIVATADEIIGKVADWYFNYVAFKRGLIASMPDRGRATIES